MFLNLRRFIVASLAVALLIPALGITTADAARHHRKHIVHHQEDRFAEIVLEASTGYVLSERNADKRLYPASLTKMMTLYMAFDALEDGTLSKNQRLTVSRHASAQEPSSLGLSPGDTIRVEDAILSIATKSANDSAVVLAEALGGSEEHFARMMTEKASDLGMTGSHFLDASGLFRPGHYSTARDMAILSRALILNHPRYYHYFSTESFTYNGQVMPNHNHLMSSYRGMDGLKTGYVYASGYNLAASAVRNGTRLIGVIFGGRTAKSRNNAMAQLLNQSFASIGSIRLAPNAPAAQRPQERAAPERVAQARPAPAARPALPAQRPYTPIDIHQSQAVADNTPLPAAGPQFNAMGLVVEQGDTALTAEDSIKNNPLPPLQPQPINTTPIARTPNGNWAIQIGAFATHDTGAQALQAAKAALHGTVSGIDSIAPLMTQQGMVYRARLSGLSRSGAQQACGILKGNCLILTVE